MPIEISDEVLKTIDTVVNRLAKKFTFGYYEVEDIKQEGVVLALEVLKGDKYDPSRPLENFLYIHLRRRLGNFKRDNYYRLEPPCPKPDSEDDKDFPKWNAWNKRKETRRNLMEPLDIDGIHDECEPNMRMESDIINNTELAEILQKIDRDLPTDLRADLLRMRANVNIPKLRKEKVIEAVKKIIHDGEIYSDD